MMKSKYIQVLQYILLLALGVGLSWMFFKDLDFSELEHVMDTGNFFWFYVVMVVSVGVYVFRTLRWQMLIKAIGYETKFHNTFAALSISYFVSFVVPRLGEVSRCLSVKKQHNVPFMELLGTVIIERVIDIISLMIMLLLTLILQFDQIIKFMQVNVFKPIYEGIILKILAGNLWLLIAAITFMLLFIFLTYYFRKYIKERSPKLVMKFLEGLKQGLISIARLKEKRLFFFYTVLIWLGYYFMTYFWFFVFKETSVLSWGACLAIVSIGTIGRSVPIQGGGMGAYHFLVNQVVLLYGVTGLFGKTLATLIHAGQTFFTFAMGLVGLIIFFWVYWKKK